MMECFHVSTHSVEVSIAPVRFQPPLMTADSPQHNTNTHCLATTLSVSHQYDNTLLRGRGDRERARDLDCITAFVNSRSTTNTEAGGQRMETSSCDTGYH